ncbi:hypothetical protein OIU77_009765 [Salix suchowensis]|uniref:Uncharacterized protein n=1 Tax=Salix suchowensis TaxID=1278906 RepID=A0ABQ9A6W9_9ROSI|nr:hypothetical protein OIU77_009765 [Salix suchowensis]
MFKWAKYIVKYLVHLTIIYKYKQIHLFYPLHQCSNFNKQQQFLSCAALSFLLLFRFIFAPQLHRSS